MGKKVIIISGSPKRDGNTVMLVDWLMEGLRSLGCQVELVHAAFLKYKISGCISCRSCQKLEKYGCVIDDEAKPVLAKMAEADIIVFATPLYFYGPSAQTKMIMDRMFSLYKWDNKAGTMRTPLKGKTLAVVVSAYEGEGMECVEKPFKITAEYSGMKFASLLVPNAGVSGEIEKRVPGAKQSAVEFAKKLACL